MRTWNEEVLEFCERISLDEDAKAVVFENLPEKEDVERQLQKLREDRAAFLQTLAGRRKESLALYAGFAVLAEEAYKERGIGMDVFADTMQDIRRWEEAYFERTGEHGLAETEWLSRHVQLLLFQLGELQFEPLEEPLCSLPERLQGLPVLNVHIPKGADLTRRQEAYQKALAFFNFDRAVLVCHSWLLGPALKAHLKPDSRILAFQSEFEIAELDRVSRQSEERIFGQISDDFAAYPAETSLQRSAKAALIAGGEIPSGVGYQEMIKAC